MAGATQELGQIGYLVTLASGERKVATVRRCIMDNFNHERWMIVVGVNRGSRLLVEECFKWANQRMVINNNNK